jgi:crossover junction endodeoxyribonuclease RuvC
MRILGIDPGSNATGYGVIDRVEGRLVHVAHGTLRPPRGGALAERLAYLGRSVAEVLATHAPEAVAVEEVFVSASPKSALVLGQARGAVLAVLGEAGMRVQEYGTQTVKKAIAGVGGADKRQMQRMVRQTLELDATPQADAADALALAICHAQAGRLAALGATARGRGRGKRRGATWVVRRAR